MATREEILRFKIEQEGEQNLLKLADSLEQVKIDSGAAETAAGQLVAELAKLERISQLAQQFERQSAALDKTAAGLLEARAAVDKLNTEYSEADKATKEYTEQLKSAEREVAKLEKSQARQSAALDKTGTALKDAGVDTSKLASEQARLAAESAKTERTIEQQAAALRANAKAAQDSSERWKRFGAALASARAQAIDFASQIARVSTATAAAAAAAAAYGAARFLSSSIQDARQFELGIARIAAATGAATEEVNALREAAREAGASTIFTAAEAASGLEILGKAGLTAAESIKTLPQVLAVAQGQSISLAEASSLVVDTIGAMGLSFDDAGRTADVLAKGANLANTTISELGKALSIAGPLALSAGQSLEETAAQIDALANAGIKGEKAGTALRSILGQLSDPASKASQELTALGISSRDLGNVLDGLSAAGGRGGKAINAFGIEAGPTLRNLLRVGTAGINELQTQLESAGGSAQAAAERINATLEGAALSIESAYEGLKIALAEPLLEPLTKQVGLATQAIRDFTQSDAFERIRTAVAKAFDDAATAARQFAESVDWEDLAGRVEQFAKDSGRLVAEFGDNAKTVLGGVADAARALSTAFDVLQTAVFGIAAAVAKLGEIGQEFVAFQTRLVDSALDAIPVVHELTDAIGIDLAKAADAAAVSAAGLGGVYDEFAARTVANANEAAEGIRSIGGAVQESSAQAGSAFAQVAQASESLIQSTDKAADAAESLSDAQKEQADSALESAKANEEAEAQAKELADAYQTLGIQSQQALDTLAANAKRAFDAIRSAAQRGEATLQDQRAAFEAYARAALEAAENTSEAARQQVEAQLKTQAAAIGATDSLERLGIVGEDALDRVAASSENAAQSLQSISASADTAANSAVRVAEALEPAGRVTGKFAEELADVAAEAREVSVALAGASKAYAEAVANFGPIGRTGSGAGEDPFIELLRQTEEVNRQTESLRRQNETYDERGRQLASLRNQYRYVSDEVLLQLAEERAALQRNQEAAARRNEERDRPPPRSNNNEPSPPPNSGGGRGGGVNLTVNLNGFFAGASDREIIDRLARELLPALRRLEQRGL